MSQTAPSRCFPDRARPRFPARAVVTGGMPYGNKDLHFGHVGGVFVQADVFSRFLRDRIGAQNVLFVSGTDCYGSPIVEDYRAKCERGEFQGSLEAFVAHNHKSQQETLAAYQVSLNLFAASSVGRFRELHQELGAQILKTLYTHGHLVRRTVPQFYDAERGTFLNGRQVQGRCPIQGCASEKAYADECSLGHQYDPADLIDPRSSLTGRRPEMRDVTNWFLDLPRLRGVLEEYLRGLEAAGHWRPFVLASLREFFEPPIIHVTKDQLERLAEVSAGLPPHRQQEGRGKSVQLVFESLEAMNQARGQLAAHSIRYRSGKTLVPFRLTGNLEWGLPVPELERLSGLTFWVWPESLWAPVSFTQAWLEREGRPVAEWKRWWCSRETQVYQFIGEDNVFFYGLPEMAIFLGLQGPQPAAQPPEGQFQGPVLVANRHILFMDKKASSSGKIKPPMARDLLNHYTADQLRAHFFSLGLGMRSVSFRPKPLNPEAPEKEADPVLKDGNLLSNAFNRAVRSGFYTAQKFCSGQVPVGEVSPEVLELAERAILDYEAAMHAHLFHEVLGIVGGCIREINQRWTVRKPYADDCASDLRKQTLIDTFHLIRVVTVLLHPIAPEGTEKVRKFLRVGDQFWDWGRIFEPLYAFMQNPEDHRLEFLAPRIDFFEKHPSQIQEHNE